MKKRVQAGLNGWRRMSRLICDREAERAGDGGTAEKARGGRVEDAKIFVRSDNNGQDQE